MTSYQSNHAAYNVPGKNRQGASHQQDLQGTSHDPRHQQAASKGSGMQNEPRNASNLGQSGKR